MIYKTFDTFFHGPRTFALADEIPIFDFTGTSFTLHIYRRHIPDIQPFLAVITISNKDYLMMADTAKESVQRAALFLKDANPTLYAQIKSSADADVVNALKTVPTKFDRPTNVRDIE